MKCAHLRFVVLIVAFALAPCVRGEQGILTFVFGPSSQDAARQSARAALGAARHWMDADNGLVEIRRSGSPDARRFQQNPDAKELEQAFDTAAMAARDSDPPAFLIALDAAAQAAALTPGARIVVAVLNAPPFSSEGERALEHLAEICQSAGVRIVVLDAGEGAHSASNPALNALATKTNGTWVRQAKLLETSVALVTPADDSTIPVPAAALSKTASAEVKPQAPGAIPQFEIPVHIRFVRTSGTGSVGSSLIDHEADFGETFAFVQAPNTSGNYGAVVGGGGAIERSYEANDKNAPLQGFVAVESPLNALKFDIDDNTNTYTGRARITATVLDAQGRAIWNGRRDVNVHGPVNKLDERRAGSIFFMRSLSLPGQGPFTLEAKVEDLVGSTSGMIQTPLKTSRNAPGLVATDAMVVRPFKGSADKFEADQVLSYEGEALSPMLNPVFRAEQPVDLQIYMRLYPDIHGAPVEMSMDVLDAGRAVAHMALPFKSGLASMAREGASSSIAGRSDNMYGGQAKEFPYLANVKGARFPPGDYRGVITIRQGKSVIKRVIAFQVTGTAPAAPVQVTMAAKAAPAPSDESENAAIVLPEIEPATVESSGLRMRDEDQKQLWQEAAKNAMGYSEHLPNFRCVQETHRFTAPVKIPDQLKEVDSFKEAIIYEDGKQHYQRLYDDGLKANQTTVADKGIRARNEFGLMLAGLFDPAVGASYKWAGHAMAMGVLCQVFEVRVSKEKTNFSLTLGVRREPVGYSGRVFIDAETGMVRRLTIEGAGLAKDFGLQSPALSLDYGMVKIGKDDYLLPLRSVLQLRHSKEFVRNETVFRNYRRFEAESEIKFQND